MLLISESCDAGCMSVVTVSHISGLLSTLAAFRSPQQSACGASTENRFTNVPLVDLIGAIFFAGVQSAENGEWWSCQPLGLSQFFKICTRECCCCFLL
jgi:hypothetical protein